MRNKFLIFNICVILLILVFGQRYVIAEEESLARHKEAGERAAGMKARHTVDGIEKAAVDGSVSEVRLLDPEIVDAAFNDLAGRHIEGVTGDFRLALDKIPVYDDALDTFQNLSPIDFEMGFTLASQYIWRGQNLGDKTAWQPYITASPSFEPLGDLSFTWWVNVLDNDSGPDDTEHDFVFDYNVDMLDILDLFGIKKDEMPYLAMKMADFNMGTGFIYYHFPPDKSHSQEFYGVLTYNLPLSPYVALYNDFGPGDGIWLELGASQDWDLKVFTVSSYAKWGYNHRQWSVSSKWQTFEYGFSIPVPVGSHMSIEPFIAHSVRIGETFDAEGGVLTKDEFYGGFNFSVEF